jgi:hypothetical protein
MGKQAKFLLLSVVLLFSSMGGIAQKKDSAKGNTRPKDSASSGFLIELSYAGQLPGGELGQIFGFNSNVQGGVYYKTRTNWEYGASFGYIFGNQLRASNIFDSIATTNGNLIANDGNYAGISYFEKGFTIQLTVGKLFPVSKNINSGILFTLSAGYIQYHIDIQSTTDLTPQIDSNYVKGYEHLTAGVCATEFLGYQYISKKQFLALFAGFEFTEAFAKSLQFDFQSETKNPNYKYSMLSSIRVGWILPILQDNTKKLTFYTH